MKHTDEKTNRRMTVERKRHKRSSVSMAVASALLMLVSHVHASLPKGLMLSLDLNGTEEGLIPSNALYPLYMPLGDLEIRTSTDRAMLMLEEGDGIELPHSSLLDPDGGGWVAMIRMFAMTDGIVMSQSDGQHGYVIYIKDGAVHASVQTGHTAMLLKERPETGITECLNKWISIEVKISSDNAMLIINRTYAGLIPLQEPFIAKDCRIRIGHHEKRPAPLIRSASVTTKGFTGAISSFKILRQ